MKKDKDILVLHGWGRAKSAEEYYHATIEEFQKKGYRVHVPDMPGFGTCPTPSTPMTLRDYATFIERYLKTQRIHPTVIIGHSFGGRVALQLMVDHGVQPKALILCGTPGYTPVRKIKITLSRMIAKIGGTLFSLPVLSRKAEDVRRWFYSIVGARDYYRAESAVMRQTFKHVVTTDLVDLMSRVTIPTLLIWGGNDIIVPPEVAKRMKKTIQNSRFVVLPHAGHSVLVDKPKQFVAHVCSFVKAL